MKINSAALMILSLALTMTSCTPFAPAPTETPAPTQTDLPTSTNTAEPTFISTETAIPKTETPSAFVLPLPSGIPLANWEGFPIMPSAIAGEADDDSYSFTTNASPDEIQIFYEQELARLGWTMLGVGEGSTGAILLIFTKDINTTSVSIIPQPDGVSYVLLVK